MDKSSQKTTRLLLLNVQLIRVYLFFAVSLLVPVSPSDACPRFPHSFLDPEALQLHNLRYSALSPSSSSSSSSSSSFSDSSPGDISGGSRSVVASAERHADRLNEQLSAQSGGEGVPQVARLSSASGPSGGSAAERMQGGEKSAVTKKSSLARSLFKRK
uniref:PUB domain-containing protein n=1 Tax=Toxoplasma gondii TgCATBr9 TaxID=943120 RepID=A0A2T6IS97_TOXGO|nr:PUB domain-containing protein [Toxoplasma gondii TgCATBr9]